MTDSGSELRTNNEKIVKLMALLQKERDEMSFLIAKQEEERKRIENEIEKLTFKLSLLKKSLGQRMQARSNYDRTIKQIQETYSGLVTDSGRLLFALTKEVDVLEEIMDKKTNTADANGPNGNSKEPPAERKEAPRKPCPEECAAAEKEDIREESAAAGNHNMAEPTDSDSEDEIRASEMSDEAVNPDEIIVTDGSETAEKIQSPRLSLDDEPALLRGSGRSSAASNSPPIKKTAIRPEHEKPTRAQPPSSKKTAFPAAPPIRKGSGSDAELESFREAYGRQHKGNSSPTSATGMSASSGRTSNSRRPFR